VSISYGECEAENGASANAAYSSTYQQAVADVFRQHKDVEALMSTVGGTSASTLGGPNYGEIVVHLKPRSERKELVNDIIEDLRPKLANFPGMRVYLQNPPTIRIGGQVTKSINSRCSRPIRKNCTPMQPGWKRKSRSCPESRMSPAIWPS
jgi:HAE1 family hydrophobic/amphiphilic exporter-1